MKNYIPFLKTKNYEFKALKLLSPEIKKNLTPFFDMHKKEKEYSSETYQKEIKDLKKHINDIELTAFYLDDLDIHTDFLIDQETPYGYLMEKFIDLFYIPVFGFDRKTERMNTIIIKAKIVKSQTVAIRVNIHDLAVPMLRKQLDSYKQELGLHYKYIHLIIDCRYCEENNIDEYKKIIENFFSNNNQNFSKLIIAGSSIPLSFANDVKMHDTKEIIRREIELWQSCPRIQNLYYGDYTIVSDSYYDKSKKMYYRTITARVLYTYDNKFVVYRGGRLSKEGHNQYKDICVQISQEPFFRGETHSNGDYFLANPNLYPKNIMPSTILTPTINSHITYMYEDFEL